MSNNSFDCLKTLDVQGAKFDYFSLPAVAKQLGDIAKLPFTLKVLLENLLRYEDGKTVTVDDIQAIADWLKTRQAGQEIMYRPARVLMQDFTGVPAVVDLAAMRDALRDLYLLGPKHTIFTPLNTPRLTTHPILKKQKKRKKLAFSRVFKLSSFRPRLACFA